MSTTSPPTDPGARDEHPTVDPTPAPPRLRRSTSDRMVGGVAGGIGTYFGIDPVLVRILFVVTTFAGGTGVLAYLIAWAVTPTDDGTVPVTARRVDWSGDGARAVGIGALVLAAVIAFDGHWWGDGFLVPVALIAGGLWVLLRRDGTTGGQLPRNAAAVPARRPDPDGERAVPVPPESPAPPPAAPREPRSRTTRVTVGVVALLAGAIGVASAAGADVSVEAALLGCLSVTGIGLVIGAFRGGARGLVGLAVPLLVALALTSVVEVPLRGGVGERHHAPATVADVDGTYRLGMGELTLDLRDLDPAELSGRLPVVASVALGELTVLVPADVSVEATARATAGEIDLFGRRVTGTGLDLDERRPARREGAGTIVLDLEVGMGAVAVR